MKLFRSIVALTLIAGTFAGVSRWNRPHHTTALLGVRQQQTPVSLESAQQKLEGVLDAVTASVNKVQEGYAKVKAGCVAEVQASAQRVKAQGTNIADLETTRQLSLERTAGLEASLANLVSQETDAHQSYESSVSQRAAALQKHLSAHKATTEQAAAIGEVLEMMKQKKAMITAEQTSTKDFKVVPPTAPTSSGSGLDFVIGVLGNIKDTSLAKAGDGLEKHNEDDSDLEKLVTSYKTSLQHIDKQYQEENARRMQAKTTARDTGEEKSLRGMLVNGEEKIDKELFSVCGANGKGGTAPAAMEAAEFLLSQFKQQSNNAITIMDGLPDLQQSLLQSSSFLAMNHQLRELRGNQPSSDDHIEIVNTVAAPVAPKPAPEKQMHTVMATSDTQSAQESAARWVMQQAAKFKDNTTQQLARAVAKSFPHGVPRRKVHPVRAVVPSQQLHTLVGTNKSHQTVGAESDPQTSSESAEIVTCVKDKQEFTDKIIKARKDARVARTDRMSAEARVKAVKSFREIVKSQKDVLTASEASAGSSWKPLQEVVTSKSFSSDLSDAETEIKTIESDVDAYIKAGGPPASAGLPKALAGIQDTLAKVKTRLEKDMTAINGVYTDALMITYPALVNQLVAKDKDLGIEADAMKDAVDASAAAAKKYELLEKDLMTQRAGVEYRCLQAGQCSNLHYQQCCSGSGTHMKKVTSWKECQEHCESKVKEGLQIAGCDMTDLHKEDDHSGSGTCFAQTACTLKASKLKCAGSLCKSLPKK